MDSTYFWTIVFFLAVGTLLIRVSFFYLYSFLKIPKELEKAFVYIPVAILPALVGPSVVFHQGAVESLLGKERTLAFIIATIACYKTKNVAITLIVGLGFLLLIGKFF